MSDVEFTSNEFERNDEVVVEHYWRVRDDNHEIVAHGEGYQTSNGAKVGFLNATEAMITALTNYTRDLQLPVAAAGLKEQHKEEGIDVGPDT